MAGHRILDLKDVDSETTEADVVNKKYVDDNLRAKFDAIAQADLDMNNNAIVNLSPPCATEDAVNKQYVDTYFERQEQCSGISTLVTTNKVYVDQAAFLKLAGGQMGGAIDMHKKRARKFERPTNPGDGVNKKYVEETRLYLSGPQANHFKYLMDDVNESSSENNIFVKGISNFKKSPHPRNKNAYLFTLVDDKDGTEQYRSQISFNIFRLPVGFYTLVVKFFPPEMRNVSVRASADSSIIVSQV